MTKVHPQALVDPKASLAEDVEVGPFTVIGPGVEIDSGTWVGPHAVLRGPLQIGRDNRIYQFAALGEAPQHKGYKDEPTLLKIGHGNTIREFVTCHRGTAQGRGETRIGDNNWLMAYCHIAHDCSLGDNLLFANSASLAGHVDVGDNATLGGFALVHQFCRVGSYAFCGFGSGINRDVPPFVTVSGQMAVPRGVNSVGLRRHGFSAERITAIKRAYKILYRRGLRLEDARDALSDQLSDSADVRQMVDFIDSSKRGLLR
ncbi:acyl-ACP--UDP-N-acetylglucosamine O-acyltransferase [Halorhodospira halochloris]|uniref:acyl-ACP--UDP-N-acetylglucosamine O-acyltransferase n=1 Tax=Halorhodospira halochloris TaxID=1052 RepID=UPI001EE9A5D3|nr:acyl-ACP--UDP-N-acetylglucosamine O-acyltransferase [Halorhodospira halochloris]MCG5530700.1 acyl-ACP--UDP-N-acetylglucosamine O-acyltransferase [Halorhodospira halochloris]MCG5547668.1 acyl-ACP--UDP-N-acetylglucosamine O-acyltransferase [Halorhodospira halochloris]